MGTGNEGRHGLQRLPQNLVVSMILGCVLAQVLHMKEGREPMDGCGSEKRTVREDRLEGRQRKVRKYKRGRKEGRRRG